VRVSVREEGGRDQIFDGLPRSLSHGREVPVRDLAGEDLVEDEREGVDICWL
jgi:hypothetical protein